MASGNNRSTAAWTDLEVGGAVAAVGIHKTLLQVAHPGALLGQQLLGLLQLCLQGLLLHVQGLLQLCSPAPLLLHLALEALGVTLSLLCTSHQSKHAHALSKRYGPCVSPRQRENVSQPSGLPRYYCHSLLHGENTGHTFIGMNARP